MFLDVDSVFTITRFKDPRAAESSVETEGSVADIGLNYCGWKSAIRKMEGTTLSCQTLHSRTLTANTDPGTLNWSGHECCYRRLAACYNIC